MRRLWLAVVTTALILLGMSLVANAQPFPDGNVVYITGTSDPVGVCVVGTEYYRTDNGARFTCGDGSWSELATGGGYDGGAVANPFLAPDGTAALPSYGFTGESGLGMYRQGNNTLRFTVLSTQRMAITNNNLFAYVPIAAASGSASAPGYAFSGAGTSGMFYGTNAGFAVSSLSFSFGGRQAYDIFEASGTEIFHEFLNPNATLTRMVRFRGDTDLTRVELYAPEDGAGTVQYILQNAQSWFCTMVKSQLRNDPRSGLYWNPWIAPATEARTSWVRSAASES